MNSLKVLISLVLSLSLVSQAGASPACEQRRNFNFTLPQQQTLTVFFNQLTALDSLRVGPDRRGVTYATKLNQVIDSTKPNLTTASMKEVGAEYLMILQLRQAIFESIGLDDPAYDQFHKRVRGILFFSDLASKPLLQAAANLQHRINDWAKSGRIDDSGRLQMIAKAEAISKMVDTVTSNTAQHANEKWGEVQDRLATYRQAFISGMGVATLAGSLIFSGVVVTGTSAAIGSSGLILSGCAIGAAGAGFSAVLERQYDRYSSAYIESLNKGTSFVCELRNEIATRKDDIFDETASAFRGGANAGCAFTMGGLMSPKLVTWSVVAAVGLAATVDGGLAVNDALLARKSYLIYQSLMAYSNAETAAAANNKGRAEFYLRQAQHLAQKAGSHLLEGILTGAVVPSFARGEVTHALREGHNAISALIGKSSDNAAMAVTMISNYVTPTATTTTASSNVP